MKANDSGENFKDTDSSVEWNTSRNPSGRTGDGLEIDVAEEELEDEDDGTWLDEEGTTEEISEADDSCDCSVMDEEVEDSTELDSS